LETKKNAKGVDLTKIELLDFDLKTLDLVESRKMYFSEFDDSPSWSISEEDGKTIIIDVLCHNDIYYSIESKQCTDRNILFDWHTNQAMTIDEYNLKYPDEKINKFEEKNKEPTDKTKEELRKELKEELRKELKEEIRDELKKELEEEN